MRGRFALALLWLLCVGVFAAHAATLTVNDVGDGDDADPGNGACATAGAVCTLRAGITEANALAGADLIAFSIDGGGPHTITPASVLPAITEALTIDGTTQPGTDCGDLWGSVAPDWRIVLDGGGGDFGGFAGLSANAPLTVRGLRIQNFAGAGTAGLRLGGADSVVQCNYVTDQAGQGINHNGADGLIGGDDAGDGNVIGGNGAEGISMFSEADGTIIRGNFIGTTVAGTARDSNVTAGIFVEGTADFTIGGTGRQRNIVSHATSNRCIRVGKDPGNNTEASNGSILNNYCGVDISGAETLCCASPYISIEDASTNITVTGNTTCTPDVGCCGYPENGEGITCADPLLFSEIDYAEEADCEVLEGALGVSHNSWNPDANCTPEGDFAGQCIAASSASATPTPEPRLRRFPVGPWRIARSDREE